MAEFLTTKGVSAHIEELIKSARERLVLISPCIKVDRQTKELLAEKNQPGLDIGYMGRKNYSLRRTSGSTQ